MVAKVDLEFTAGEAYKAVKRRDLIIVIDVLRSCSTVINLLAKGAKSATPTATLREARDLRRKRTDYLLFGEREGLKPKGFDFGNSPCGFSAQDVRGRNIILTTTSGTLAMTRCRSAEWVLLGSFLNVKVVARKARRIAQTCDVGISLVLSGDKGEFSLEDFICAGAIANEFHDEALSDKVAAAVLGFREARSSLCENIMKTQHARHLISIGSEKDVEFSCQLDSVNVVPMYRNGKIGLRNDSGFA